MTHDEVRFSARAPRGYVTLFMIPCLACMFTDINGPKGGVDKHCLLEVKTEKSGVLVISSLASDWRTALDDGLERLVRALTRTMDRQRKPARTRLAKPTLEVN